MCMLLIILKTLDASIIPQKGRSFALYFFASYIQGISGLKCYQCNDVPHPHNCNNTKICEDVHEVCISAEDVNDRFMLSYKLGCTTRAFCDGGLVLFGRRKRNLRHACCSFDLCNKYDITSTTPETTQATKQQIVTSKISTHMPPTATSRPSQTTREVPTIKTTAHMVPTTTSQPSQTTREVPTTKPTTLITRTTTPVPRQTTRQLLTTKTTTHITSATMFKTTREKTTQTPAATTPFACAGHNFYHWKRTCFFLQTKTANWTSSVDSCKSVSMNLAVIREGDKHQAIVHFAQDILKLNRHYTIWLGGHYTKRNNWQWIDGHSIGLHDRRWKDGESREHACMVLHKGLWYGRGCNDANPSLCEKLIH